MTTLIEIAQVSELIFQVQMFFLSFDFTSGIMSKEDFMEHLGVIGLVGGIGVAAAVGAAAVAAPVAAPVAPVAGGLFALFAAAPAVVAAPVVVPVVVPVGAAVAAGAGMSVLISELLPVSESTKRKLKNGNSSKRYRGSF